jgi:hypothetical protein
MPSIAKTHVTNATDLAIQLADLETGTILAKITLVARAVRKGKAVEGKNIGKVSPEEFALLAKGKGKFLSRPTISRYLNIWGRLADLDLVDSADAVLLSATPDVSKVTVAHVEAAYAAEMAGKVTAEKSEAEKAATKLKNEVVAATFAGDLPSKGMGADGDENKAALVKLENARAKVRALIRVARKQEAALTAEIELRTVSPELALDVDGELATV